MLSIHLSKEKTWREQRAVGLTYNQRFSQEGGTPDSAISQQIFTVIKLVWFDLVTSSRTMHVE